MKIIFFDGNCPMCHSWVKRIIRWDKDKIFKFSPLTGDLAQGQLKQVLPNYIEEDTIIYFDHGKAYLRSDAAIQIFSQLGFPFSFITPARLLPRFIRDGVYRWVANRRYKFGQRYDSCPLPPEEWKDRFI